MRTRKEIENDLEQTFGKAVDDIVGSLAVEVLLDIRDLLSPKPRRDFRDGPED